MNEKAPETLSELMSRIRAKLAAAGVQNPALDARILVREGGQFSDENMLSGGSVPLAAEVIEKIEKMADARAAGAPVSRLIGRREFWGLDFAITEDTLDPRPDTEILIEKALLFARSKAAEGAIPPLRILDLGTGSGCILIALLKDLPNATGVGIDINPGAAKAAEANAQAHGVADRAEFRIGDWLEPLEEEESFDLIVSNPPYIPESDIPNLAKEVRNHDPILALSGGVDGLDPYRHLLMGVKKHLNCGGRALFEFGAGQAPDIARLVDDSHATLLGIYPDLAGIPRVAEVSWG